VGTNSRRQRVTWRDFRSGIWRCRVTRCGRERDTALAPQALLATPLTRTDAIRALSPNYPATTSVSTLAPIHAAVGRLILIVERDRGVRDLQQHFLGAAGFRIEFVDDAQAALERARVDQPALIITEILLPGVDGLTLCRRLREEPATRDIPVIVFSILAATARAAEAGAQAFLRKPLVESVFLAAVQDLIGAESVDVMEDQWVSQ
jgi:CheY-like chemotaxis protein